MVSFNRISFAALLATACGGLTLAGCSSSSNQTPPTYGGDGGSDATTTDSGSDATTADTGSGEDSEAPDAGSDTGTTETDASPDASGDGGTTDTASDAPSDVVSSDASDASDAAACVSGLSDAGCWVCPTASTGSVQFLNQCAGTGVKCVSFDNASRLPAGYDGGLN